VTASVVRAGFLTTVQDLGRLGLRRFGVSVSGAADTHALRISNLLAGNDEEVAGLEITAGSVCLHFEDQRLVAWSGGNYETAVNGRALSAGYPAVVGPNEELSISGPRGGCRAWLAISGGIDVPTILASRSTDLRAKFGGVEGRELEEGDVIALGKNSDLAESWIRKLYERKIAPWAAPYEWVSPAKDDPVLRVVRGADWERFDDRTHSSLTNESFAVSAASDRMGVRLEGAELKRADQVDLVSEAVAPGTVQVPPNGDPILLLGDCQTIGGYPKIAHVVTVDLPIAAQLRPGDWVRFREVSLADAHRLLCERERDLQQFRCGIRLQTS
jgi:antagonist of KipI